MRDFFLFKLRRDDESLVRKIVVRVPESYFGGEMNFGRAGSGIAFENIVSHTVRQADLDYYDLFKRSIYYWVASDPNPPVSEALHKYCSECKI